MEKKKKNTYDYKKTADHIYCENRNGHKSYKVMYKGINKRFSDYEEALKYVATLTLDDGKVDSEVKGQETYEFYAKKLLSHLKENKKISTYETKRAILENIILPNFPDKPMNKITRDDCYSFRSLIFEKDFATNYKNAIIVVFKQVFNYAEEYYDVNISCVKKVKRFSKTEDEKIDDEEKSVKVWEPEEFNKFIICVDTNYYKTMFSLLITSWARIGEVQALRWNAYDGKSIHVFRNIIKVKETINSKCFVEVSVKTTKGNRVLDLPEDVCAMLDEMKEKQMKISGFNENWYIFNRWNGKKYLDGSYPIPRTCIYRAFHKAIVSAGVNKIRVHDLRHSGATHAILSGEDIKAVSERLGHADINTTLEIYHHAIAKAKRKLMVNTSDFVNFKNENEDEKDEENVNE